MSVSPPQKSSKPSPVPGPSMVTPASGLAALNFSPTMIEIGSTVEEPETTTEPLTASPPDPPADVGASEDSAPPAVVVASSAGRLRRVCAVVVAAAGGHHQREGDGAAEQAASQRCLHVPVSLFVGNVADGTEAGCPASRAWVDGR